MGAFINKNIARLLIISLMSIISVSCTQNNGNIGELFGSWYLESLEVDGIESESYDGNLFFAFQSSVISLTLVGENNTTNTIYGSWSKSDDILYLNFDDSNYLPHSVTGFTTGTNACEVIHLTNDTIILEYINADAQLYCYQLTKR